MKTSEAKEKAERYAQLAEAAMEGSVGSFPEVRAESIRRAHALASIGQVYATIYAAQKGYQG